LDTSIGTTARSCVIRRARDVVPGIQRGGVVGAAIVRNRLKRIQYRPSLIDRFRTQTGLSLEPEPA
jgi:hypothetical protein